MVVGPLRVMQNMAAPGKGLSFSLVDGYKTCLLVGTEGSYDYVIDGSGVSKTEEVEMFFPGVAFELPEYIK